MLGFVELSELNRSNQNLFLGSLSEFALNNSGIITKPHRINYFQILLSNSESGHVLIDSAKYELKKNSIYAVSKGQVVKYNFTGKPQGYVILFSEEFINQNSDDMDWINTKSIFSYDETKTALLLHDSVFSELTGLYEKLESEMSNRSNISGNKILINLLITFLLVAERNLSIERNSPKTNNSCLSQIHKFKCSLESNYKDIRSVNFYADLMNITPKKLNKIIFNTLGKPAKKVIEERVILESKRLLVHSDYSVKEIGSSLGFSDPANFNKFFKKYSGFTPLNFRSMQNADLHN